MIYRLAIHFLAEAEQQLRQITCRLEIGPGGSAVAPFVAISSTCKRRFPYADHRAHESGAATMAFRALYRLVGRAPQQARVSHTIRG
jgi:hypothetical protein